MRLVLIAALALLVLCAARARAHDWYEPACCGDKDCHPVSDEAVTDQHDGVAIEGFGILSYTDTRLRWSRDNANHLCVTSARKLLCVYRRPKGM